jgi:hypothetical protein
MTYLAEIETRVAGIPCMVGVRSFFHQPPHLGSPLSCDSADDFYGYTDAEWEILDRRGRKASWLEKKLTAAERARVEQEVAQCMLDDA